MSVLFRIVAALLIAVPAFLVLVIVFALAGRRRTPLPRREPSSLEAGSSDVLCASNSTTVRNAGIAQPAYY